LIQVGFGAQPVGSGSAVGPSACAALGGRAAVADSLRVLAMCIILVTLESSSL
jgi:hypothetical protein